MATAMATWLTGLLVVSWTMRSLTFVPRKSQMSPVAAVSMASASEIGSPTVASVGTVTIWKLLGLAAVVGIAAGGSAVVVVRRRRWRHYDADDLRRKLQDRLAEAEAVVGP